MKKLFVISTLAASLIALAALTSCGGKDNSGYKELIAGKWVVKSYYHWYHDFTDESLSNERTYTLSDTNYIGYDSAEFNTNGTMRWHMNDRYVSSGMFSDPYINYEWRIKGDSLFVSPNWVADNIAKYAIKELNSEALVIEQHLDNEHPEYSHHHWEQIHRYTFSRCKK